MWVRCSCANSRVRATQLAAKLRLTAVPAHLLLVWVQLAHHLWAGVEAGAGTRPRQHLCRSMPGTREQAGPA